MNGLPSPTSDIPITNKHVDKCRDLMKKSLSRIQKQSVEMEQVGNEVLHELRRQDFQMYDICHELDIVERQIETSKTLVRKGFGYSVSDFLPNDKTNKKNHATDRTESDAKFNLAPSLTSDKSPYFAINEQGGGEFIVDEIYEVEEYSLLRRSWKSVGLFSMHGVAAGKSNRIVLENRSSNSLIWELSDDFKDSSWQYTSKKVFTTIDSLWGQKSWNSCLRRRKWIKKSQRNKKMSRDSSYRSTRSNSVCSNPIVTYDGPCVVDEDKELDMCIVTLSNTLDKVDGLSKQINEEVKQQKKQIDNIEGKVSNVLQSQVFLVRKMKSKL